MPEFPIREDLPYVVVQRYSNAAKPLLVLPDIIISAHAFQGDALRSCDRFNDLAGERNLYPSFRVVRWDEIGYDRYDPYILEPL